MRVRYNELHIATIIVISFIISLEIYNPSGFRVRTYASQSD